MNSTRYRDEVSIHSVVVTEYVESEGEEPVNEDGTTIMSPGDDPETKTRRDTHRRYLERQQSQEYDR